MTHKILITAGPTYERIDPVRFIGNYSSGKMGIALAHQCLQKGMEVELVLGPVSIDLHTLEAAGPELLKVTHVESAAEMYEACISLYPQCDAAILCAAVADFTPITIAPQKIKREGEELILRLKPTKDIAHELGKMKAPGQLLIGFALETNDEMHNAQKKLERKNLDFIVLNSLRDSGAGFRHDTNKITIISPQQTLHFPLKTKEECAADIIGHLHQLLLKTC